MELIGTARIYINNDVLGGRKYVEAAVTRSKKKETLISLSLLKKWDLVHDSFPNQTISDYIYSKQRNRSLKAYSTLYNFNAGIYEEHRPLKPPSSKCNKLRDQVMEEFSHVFEEELEPNDRMKVEPVKMKLKEGYISPSLSM